MLKDGIIEEAKSKWANPLLIIHEKPDCIGNKKYSLVIDYISLNREIKDEKWSLGSNFGVTRESLVFFEFGPQARLLSGRIGRSK